MRFVKNTIILIILAVMLVPSVQAQEPVYWDVVQKIRDEGLNRSQVMEIVSYMSDVYGPRLTNSPSYDRAIEWAGETFKKYGMENITVEPWGEFGLGWENEYVSVHMTAPRYQPVFAFPRAWTRGTNGKIIVEAVLVNTDEIFTEADLDQYRGKLNGKIVLTKPIVKLSPNFEPEARRRSTEELDRLAVTQLEERPGMITIPRDEYQKLRDRKPGEPIEKLDSKIVNEFLEKEGAAVIAAPGRGGFGAFYTSGSQIKSKDDPKPLPTLSMAAEHYNRILRILEKNIPVMLEVEIRNTWYEDDPTDYNITADLPGTDLKDEVVILGNHYDSWHTGTGAADNACGCAIVMEALRILKEIGVRPRRTIRAAFWGGEEQGLYGSRGYVNRHYARMTGNYGNIKVEEKLPDYDKMCAYFNFDNGTGRIRGVNLQGNERLRPIFEAWMQPFRDLEMTHLSPASVGGTDHLSFDWAGLPGFQFIQDRLDYRTQYHTNMDVYDRLVPEDLRQASVIFASFAYHAAMGDKMLPRKPFPGDTK